MSLPVEIGTPIQGGFLAGYISLNEDGAATHALIVPGGDADIHGTGDIAWKTSNTATAGTASLIDGPANFAAMLSAGDHPAAEWIQSFMNGDQYGGYSDWYMPAQAELDVIYWGLKPRSISNNASFQYANPWAIPARPNGDERTAENPPRTDVENFIDTGPNQGPPPNDAYWGGNSPSAVIAQYMSSTSAADASYRLQTFRQGTQENRQKNSGVRLRAVRRVDVAEITPPTPEQIWRATFANASGNPPMQTALIRSDPVQRLVNHNATLWAGKPGHWKGKPVWVLLTAHDIGHGNLHKIMPGQVIWVKKDVPFLKDGRWVKVFGPESHDRPGSNRLLCLLWEPDND